MTTRISRKSSNVSIYAIGWSRRENVLIFLAWIIIFLPTSVWAIWTYREEVQDSGSMLALLLWAIGIATSVPVLAPFFAYKARVRRQPFLSLTQSGLLTKQLRLIPWSQVLRLQLLGDPDQRDLYVEVRAPATETSKLDRFVLLFECNPDS